MSNFGDDNGSDGKGAPVPASPNGFRLDSSQSSWLMDRLQALSEEDKRRLEAAQLEALQAGQGQAHKQGQGTPPMQGDQQHYPGGGYGQGTPGAAPPPSSHVPHQQGRDQGVPPKADAQHIQQKIDNLEQKLAEISTLSPSPIEAGVQGHSHDFQPPQAGYQTGYEDASHLPGQTETPVQAGPPAVGSEGPYVHRQSQQYQGYEASAYPQEGGHQGQAGFENRADYNPAEGVYGSGEEVPSPQGFHGHPAGHDPHSQQGAAGYEAPSALPPAMGYAPQSEAYTEGRAVDHHAYVPSDQGGALQLPSPEDVSGYDPAPNEDPSGQLPQFLAPEAPRKLRRSGYVNVVGGLIAVLIVGGMAYNYMGHGVSDVVKSEFGGFVSKEKMQLSDFKSKANSEISTKTVKSPQVAALSPADFAGDFWVSKVSGVAGQTVPVAVRLPRGAYPSAFLVVRGLPKWASMNKGRLANGAWVVGLADANSLTIAIPPEQAGVFSFVMEFVHSPDADPIVRTVRAEIRQNPAFAGDNPVDQGAIQSPDGARKSVGGVHKALEDKWLQSGARLLKVGDVTGARLAFSHLAEQGSGRGAMAMAMTYDPKEAAALRKNGVKPDVKRARFWYKRALSLGHDKALERLKALK